MNEKNLMLEENFTTYNGEFKMQSWLLNSDISTGAKMTFTVLTCCSGGNTHTWVSQKYLADKLSVSIRTIQRYINELIENKLIQKTHQYIKGQFRCVYYFLALKLEKIKKIVMPKTQQKREFDNLSSLKTATAFKKSTPTFTPPLVAKTTENPPQSEATICRLPNDKLSPLSYKVLNNLKRNKNISPLPPKVLIQAKEIFADKEKSVGGDSFKLQNKETLFLENSIWSEIKINLQNKLSLKEINTWLEPIFFEDNKTEIILRAPNSFFKSYVANKYKNILDLALKERNILTWRLEIYTEKQQEVSEEYFKNQELQRELQRESEQKNMLKQEIIHYKNLSNKEKFKILAKEYPIQVGLWNAEKVFFDLIKRKEIEDVGMLINAIQKAKKTESWNKDKGRWIPSLTKWLTEHRWEDCQI